MPNALFTPAREGFVAGEIDWDTAVVKASLVRSYTYNAAHKFVSDVTTAGGVLAATQTVPTRAATSGNATSGNFTFTAPAANASAHSVLLYQSSAVTGGADVAATAQRVIGWWDTGTNLPVPSLNGGDVTITAPAGGWFSV